MKITDKVLKYIDDIKITRAIFVDLSEAFDTLDHSTLIKKKLAHYGINDTALEWFTCYLTGHKQKSFMMWIST